MSQPLAATVVSSPRAVVFAALLGLFCALCGGAFAQSPPSGPPNEAAPWLLAPGRVLDFALLDLDGDQTDELLLLFAARLELWRAEGAGWRFVQMSTLTPGAKPTRSAALGRLTTCPLGPGGSPLIYASSDDLGQTLAFVYNGRGLRVAGKTAGAVLACAADGPLHARYEAAAARFSPALQYDDGRTFAQAPEPFLAVLTGGANALFLLPDGRLVGAAGELKELRCGLTPQRLADGRLVCSLPLVEPGADGWQILSVPGSAVVSQANVASPPAPGAIWALRVWRQNAAAKEELIVLRYFPERDESRLLRHAL